MMRKFIAMVATIAFAMATFATTPASAQHWRDRDRGDYSSDRHGGYDNDRRGRGGYYNRPECYDRQGRNHCYDRHDDDDNDDAVAAGVIGLVLGAVIASAVANNNNNNRQNDGYYNDRGYGDDRRYGDGREYRGDDGYYAQHCTQQVRRWDRRAGRYVIVDVPC